MKIIHVLPALTKGGAERVAVELANYAVDAGHEVSIVLLFSTDITLLPKALHKDVKLFFVSNDDRRKYLRTLSWLQKHRKWLFDQDILHCHLTYGAFFGTCVKWMQKLSGKKRPLVVETYHAVGMPIPKINRWLHARLATQRDALALMAEDSYWKKFTNEHPKLITEIIPNGISISENQISASQKNAYRQKLGIPETCKYVVGTIGRLHPDRQPTRYVPIFAKVAQELGHDVHFVIAGDGTEREKVEEAIAEQGLQNQVHLAGLILDTSLPFSIFDLYISLNVGSITGISILEATLHRIPTIAIQVLDKYKAGPDDWVWSSGDTDEIAKKISELLRWSNLKEELASKQFDYAMRHHSTEAMIDSYNKLYQSAMKKKQLLLKHSI